MSKIKTGKDLPCQHCGKLVYIPRNRLDTFQYCSRSCKALATRTEVTRPCDCCGKEFTHISSRANSAKYCSRQCYYKATSQKGSIEKSCKHCAKTFKTSPSRDRVFCSVECRAEFGKAEHSQPNSFSAARKWMHRRGLLVRCADCGFDTFPQILGVHHIDENRENNHVSNLVCLCPNCHSIRHMKHVVHNSSGDRGKYS